MWQSQAQPTPPVSVVVMTHNRCEELCRTLTRMTSLPERVPIIVMDNGSTDDTVETTRHQFPDVSVVRCGANLGAVARNLGVALARTPYVAFCDDDTWWQPGSLSCAANLLDAHPRLASITARILVEPDLREDPITPELRHSPVPAPPDLPGPALMSVLAGATMFRVSAFQQVGGFSRKLWLGGEEELLSLDLASRGWWMCWAENVVVHHAPSRQRDSRRRRQLGIRNTIWTSWLRRPVPVAVRRTAAVLEAAAGAPWVLRERRVVPPGVEAALQTLEATQLRSPARRYVG